MTENSLSDPAIILGLQDEIRRNEDSRYDHRLHVLLLAAQGFNCVEIASMLGDPPRTVQHWVRSFEDEGLAGISENDRPGRPPRLKSDQLDNISLTLRGSPEDVGLSGHLWDGKTLSEYIEKHYKITIGVRQCQRMFRKLGFRLRKPRPVIVHANPDDQKKYKKTSQVSQRSNS